MKKRSALTRLDALPQRPSRLLVDRTFPGKIHNASLLTSGPATGHGFWVDRTTVEQVTARASGIRGRWTHGGLSDDGLARHLGAWEHVRTEPFWLCATCATEGTGPSCASCAGETEVAWRAVGDFTFAASAHKLRPDGLDVAAPVYLMDRAEEDPRSLGISIVARFQFEQAQPSELEGNEGEASELRKLARLAGPRDLKRGDWVADPAANPIGLHAGTDATSELTEGAERALDRLVARAGPAEARLRAFAFLARFFGDEPEPDDNEPRLEAETHAEELAALRATVASLQAAEATRRRGEAEAYLAELRVRSAALNAPIPAADLTKVERFLAAGDPGSARELGQAFLIRSEARSEVPFKRDSTRTLGLDSDPKKSAVAAQAYALRARGFTVELSPDGTEITQTTPPKDGAP